MASCRISALSSILLVKNETHAKMIYIYIYAQMNSSFCRSFEKLLPSLPHHSNVFIIWIIPLQPEFLNGNLFIATIFFHTLSLFIPHSLTTTIIHSFFHRIFFSEFKFRMRCVCAHTSKKKDLQLCIQVIYEYYYYYVRVSEKQLGKRAT